MGGEGGEEGPAHLKPFGSYGVGEPDQDRLDQRQSCRHVATLQLGYTDLFMEQPHYNDTAAAAAAAAHGVLP
jgi:hypothetical protein